MSKIVNTNKKIEKAVVGSYKKIEDTTVKTYKKIEDKFIDLFLREENETIAEAKSRIIQEQEKIKSKQENVLNNRR